MRLHNISVIGHKTLFFRLLGAFVIGTFFTCDKVSGLNINYTCPDVADLSSGSGDPNASLTVVDPGDNLTLRCCVKNTNASNINIKYEYDNTYSYLDRKFLEVENENAIVESTFENIQEDHFYTFSCVHNNDGYEQFIVNGRSDPSNVKAINCFVKDFDTMECKIDVENKYEYNIKRNLLLDGIEMPTDNSGSYIICTYIKNRRFYNFNVTSSNSKKEIYEVKEVDQYSIVTPTLKDVKLTNVTANGVQIVWNILNYNEYNKYTNGLFVNIFLKAQKFDNLSTNVSWNVYNYTASNIYTNGLFFNTSLRVDKMGNVSITRFLVDVSNLYANVDYEVHLRAKANSTNPANDRMWSEIFEKTFITSKSVPKSPKTAVGSFYMQGENITLFWRKMAEYEQCGEEFGYEIDEIKENGQNLKSEVEVGNFSALVKINFINASQYEFKLKTKNKEGLSSQSSIFKINPSYANTKIKPISKFYHRNESYMVSWLRPDNFEDLSSFTLFWCDAGGSQDMCAGPVEFKNLDRNTLSYTIKEFNKCNDQNIALSENFENNSFSSGMKWAKCSKNVKSDELKIKLSSHATDESITIQWTRKCWHVTAISKYTVEYCTVNKTYCVEKDIDKNANNYTINNLEKSTSYEISIKPVMIHDNYDFGNLKSEPITVTTIENNTIKYIIIAVAAIFSIVAFIILVFGLKNKCRDMRDLKAKPPLVLQGHNTNSESINDYEKERNQVCGETVPFHQLTLDEISANILEPHQKDGYPKDIRIDYVEDEIEDLVRINRSTDNQSVNSSKGFMLEHPLSSVYINTENDQTRMLTRPVSSLVEDQINNDQKRQQILPSDNYVDYESLNQKGIPLRAVSSQLNTTSHNNSVNGNGDSTVESTCQMPAADILIDKDQERMAEKQALFTGTYESNDIEYSSPDSARETSIKSLPRTTDNGQERMPLSCLPNAQTNQQTQPARPSTSNGYILHSSLFLEGLKLMSNQTKSNQRKKDLIADSSRLNNTIHNNKSIDSAVSFPSAPVSIDCETNNHHERIPLMPVSWSKDDQIKNGQERQLPRSQCV